MLQTSLKGVRVIDFSQIGAGPMCSMYLGDLGADVIKVEPPSGDLGRTLGRPWIGDESPIHIAFNRNKRSLAVDMKTEAGRRIMRDLVRDADILIESFRPGVMEKLGLGYDSLRARHPRLIYCSVSAFGQTGPSAGKPGVDGIVQAESGLMGLIGFSEGEPCKVQAPVVDVATGIVAAVGVLAALVARERGAAGEKLDVSLFASAVALQQSALTEYLGSGQLPVKAGSAAPYAAPNEAFRTADGWIMVAAYNGGRWERLCKVLGLEGHPMVSDLADLDTRVRERDAMRRFLAPAFLARTTDDWFGLLSDADVLCGKVATYHDLASDPQMAHLKLIESLGTTDGSPFRVPAFPVNSADRRGTSRPPPAFGEHTIDILREAGLSDADTAALLDARVVFSGEHSDA